MTYYLKKSAILFCTLKKWTTNHVYKSSLLKEDLQIGYLWVTVYKTFADFQICEKCLTYINPFGKKNHIILLNT